MLLTLRVKALTHNTPLVVACCCRQVKAVGSTNKMMAGGCEPFCVWNSELTTDDVEMAIELDDFPAWVEDVKKIFAQDLKENGLAADRCVAGWVQEAHVTSAKKAEETAVAACG
jgi:hypothetical protein